MNKNNKRKPTISGNDRDWDVKTETVKHQRLYAECKTIDPKTGMVLHVESNHSRRSKGNKLLSHNVTQLDNSKRARIAMKSMTKDEIVKMLKGLGI